MLSGKIGDTATLSAINTAYGLGLSSEVIDELAGVLAGLGGLDIPDAVIADLVAAMSRIQNIEKVFYLVAQFSDYDTLVGVNAVYSLGLRAAQLRGISEVLTALGGLSVSDQLLADAGRILSTPGYLHQLLLFCGKIGTVTILTSLNEFGGTGLSASEIVRMSRAMQDLASLSIYEPQLVAFFGALARIVNPAVVFQFLRQIGNVSTISAMNDGFDLGLAEDQVAHLAGTFVPAGRHLLHQQ